MPRPIDPYVRFDRHVDFDGPAFKGSPCWIWTGAQSRGGYAQFQTGGRGSAQISVHRWNYERYIGPIPDGFQIDHLCKVRNCVNPDHLEAVTGEVNNARSDSPTARNARMTACAKGLHPLAGDNLHPTYLRHGQRRCHECHREAQRVSNARRYQTPEGVTA